MNRDPSFPLVSVITVNFNQPEATVAFLNSIRQITYPRIEVIVVDNASPTGGLAAIIPLHPKIKFIQSVANLGFAGGNNLGVKAAAGEYLLFINNDTEVEPGFLEPLVACLQQHPNAGMASPKIKYFHHPNVIQYAGGKAINPFTGRGNFIGHGQTDDGSYETTQPTELIHGAALLVSRKLMDTIGWMDETYFLYYEELDWCERAKRAGFALFYVGQAVIYHKESLSVGKHSPLRTYYMTRNRLLFIRKNYRLFQRWSALMFFIAVAIPKNTILFILQSRLDLLRAFWRGVWWHISTKHDWKIGKTIKYSTKQLS